MLLITPQLILYDRVSWYRRIVVSLTSEQWSIAGVISLFGTSYCGWMGWTWMFAVCLLLHCYSDTNDGQVYRDIERGRRNGYGLYLDHLCDAIGAPAVALGGYFLLGNGTLVVAGLVLFYLIAVHSWLYKIVQVSRGQMEGLDFWVVLEPGSRYRRLGPDDLALVLSTIAILRSVPLLVILNLILGVVFLYKAARTIAVLRTECWRPADGIEGIVSPSLHAG